ncbi:MAG: hypothetical protein R2939_21930 [Kofleriaceae bacterium]
MRAAPGLARVELERAELWTTAPGAWASPADLPTEPGLPCDVPGTVGAALRAAGVPTDGRDLDGEDAWFRIALPAGDGPARVVLHGVATGADCWIDGVGQAGPTSALRPHVLAAPAGARELVLACRALTPALAGRKLPRVRWKTRLVASQQLRFARTPLLGRMPGWAPGPAPVGPFRPIVVERGPAIGARVTATMRGDDGIVRVQLDGVAASAATVRCAGAAAALTATGPGTFRGELVVPTPPRWWPHTHGAPTTHAVVVDTDAGPIDLGVVGFREVVASHRPGLALAVNGVPVFARGASWMPVDAVAMGGTADAIRAELVRLRDAGANLVRVPGTGCYEHDAFHDACDELGLMVWQDALLANLDYPTDDAFAAELAAEVDALLDRLEPSPSLVVVCGGSEIEQQATMWGHPPEELSWPLLDTIIPAAVAARRPELAYVRNSPTGGPLPFHVGVGVAHYYGVGAYLRPLDDARRAEVGFATECLAFANPPAAGPVDGAGVPRDGGAAWDFADVRDHYLGVVHGVDPAALRSEAPHRYAALSRRVSGEVMARAYAEWRRTGSRTAGALVWMWRDVVPGAGWGVIGSDGAVKPPYWYLRRAWAPLALVTTDEGQDGLVVHALNDGPTAVAGTLRVRALRDGHQVVAEGTRALALAPHATVAISVDEVVGRFVDSAYAYRFGPPGHDAIVVTLERGAEIVADVVHHVVPPSADDGCLSIEVTPTAAAGCYAVALTTSRLAAPVVIEAPGFALDDDYVTVVPGWPRRVRAVGVPGAPPPVVRVHVAPR